MVAGLPRTTLRPQPIQAPGSDPTYDRQSRLFGDRGQAVLAAQKIGVIGAGGAGSLLVEYLARLGVGDSWWSTTIASNDRIITRSR